MALVLATALMSFVDLLVRQTVTDEAEDYLAGATDTDDFIESIIGYLMVGVIQAILQIAAAVVTIIWMYRVAANHRTLHRGGTWGPGWAIGGWFLPPVVYVIPMLMLRELWKASNPDVPIGGEWRTSPSSPLPIVWVLLYSAVPVVSVATSDEARALWQGCVALSLLLAGRDLDRAEDAARWAHARLPWVAFVETAWGMVRIERGDLDAGLAAFTRARRTDATGGMSALHKAWTAVAHVRRGRREDARRMLEELRVPGVWPACPRRAEHALS